MYVRRRRFSRKPVGRGRRWGRRSALKKKGGLRKFVKKIISQQVETKENTYISTNTAYNGVINSAGDLNQVCAYPVTGTGINQRIGDQIRLRHVNIKGHYYINNAPWQGSSSTTVPTTINPNTRIGVRIFVVTCLQYPTYDQFNAYGSSALSSLLRYGNSVQGFDGTVKSLYMPVNTDRFICHYDKMSFCTIGELTQTSSGSTTATLATLDVSKSFRMFNINLKIKNKLIKFVNDDTSQGSWSPVLLIGYSHLDDSAADSVSTNINMNYMTLIKYEDA